MARSKEAKAAYMREWQEKNRERRRAYQREQYHKNLDSRRSYARAQNAKHSDSNKAYRLKAKYGIAPEEKDALLLAQGGGCAICKTDVPTKQGWVVDHDHITDKVRGILCTRCNTGLGLFLDNKAALLAAASYLDLHQ